jgi:hypothetical protein
MVTASAKASKEINGPSKTSKIVSLKPIGPHLLLDGPGTLMPPEFSLIVQRKAIGEFTRCQYGSIFPLSLLCQALIVERDGWSLPI